MTHIQTPRWQFTIIVLNQYVINKIVLINIVLINERGNQVDPS